MSLRPKGVDNVLSTKEIKLAEKSSRILSEYIKSNKKPVFQLINKEGGPKLELPPKALKLLLTILEEIGRGQVVTLNQIGLELTSQEAADLLNVSRPYLISLLNKGEIPFRKVGTKRRILTSDLLAYKKEIDIKRRQALLELSKQAQELDMGY